MNKEPTKILIAEDDLTSLKLLTCVLQKRGYDVLETLNGSEAWQVLEKPDSPKLLILDWMMPEVDGLEVVRRIRALQTDRPPYIIMLTCRAEREDIIAGLAAGANDYLTKPFDPAELLVRVEGGERTIEMQLRQHRQRVNAQQFRVEACERFAEMQGKLISKSDELRRSKAELRAMKARLQAAQEAEHSAAYSIPHDALEQHLDALRTDLIDMGRHLGSGPPPEPALLRGKIVGMVKLLERMIEHTQTTSISSLMSV